MTTSRFVSTFFAFFALLLLLTGCSSREIIAHDMDERDANEILVFLSGKGIEAIKEEALAGTGGGGGGAKKWNISVPSEQKRESMAILSQAGLPRRPVQNLLDLFKDSGLVPSELQQEIRYQTGLAEQIASVIRKMDGIVDAEVQLAFPKEDILNPNAKKGKITASVYVKHTGVLNDPNSLVISRIRSLVSGSVPELNYDNVTVVPDLARYREATPSGGEEGMKSGDKPLVSIWTIIIAKESVTRFRIVFFSFFVTTILLLTLLFLLIFRIMPILHAAKTSGSLFSLRRIHPDDVVKKDEPKSQAGVVEAGKNPSDADEEEET